MIISHINLVVISILDRTRLIKAIAGRIIIQTENIVQKIIPASGAKSSILILIPSTTNY